MGIGEQLFPILPLSNQAGTHPKKCFSPITRGPGHFLAPVSEIPGGSDETQGPDGKQWLHLSPQSFPRVSSPSPQLPSDLSGIQPPGPHAPTSSRWVFYKVGLDLHFQQTRGCLAIPSTKHSCLLVRCVESMTAPALVGLQDSKTALHCWCECPSPHLTSSCASHPRALNCLPAET